MNHVIDMSDFFTTLGWEDLSNKKIIKSGSLFEFSIKKNKIKKNNILFISGAIASKTPHFSGAYGYCEEKAIKIEFCVSLIQFSEIIYLNLLSSFNLFLNKLSISTKSSINILGKQ